MYPKQPKFVERISLYDLPGDKIEQSPSAMSADFEFGKAAAPPPEMRLIR
jgi:hypothetical protein